MRHAVLRADELADGERAIVTVAGRSIGVFRRGERYYALLNRCPHQGGPVCRGGVVALIESDRPGQYRIDAERVFVTCPWHNWEFDLETGRSYVDPARIRARPYDVSIERGRDVLGGRLEGPYVAEVYPVEVDRDYVVVTLPAS